MDLYAVYDDSHGIMGYFLDKQKAYDYAKELIEEIFFFEDTSKVSNSDIEKGNYLVWVNKKDLDITGYKIQRKE